MKNQVASTLPYAFRERYPTTLRTVDASERFVETPSDLMFQPTPWSNYSHHNTLKFLVACTPKGRHTQGDFCCATCRATKVAPCVLKSRTVASRLKLVGNKLREIELILFSRDLLYDVA